MAKKAEQDVSLEQETSAAQEPPESPYIADVTVDVVKKLLNQNVLFVEVIEATETEFSVITKTRTGEVKQYRALAGGEAVQIFDGEKEILE